MTDYFDAILLVDSSRRAETREIASAIADLRMSRAKTLLGIQALVDAAELAAEQFQDKRLEMLDQPPGLSTEEMIAEMMITFVLEAPLIGDAAKMLKGPVKAIFRARINHHRLAATAARADVGKARLALEKAYDRLRESGNTVERLRLAKKKRAKKELRRASRQQALSKEETNRLKGELDALHDAMSNGNLDRRKQVRKLVEGGKSADKAVEKGADYVAPAIKAARAGKTTNPNYPASDSAGVSILKAARMLLAQHRYHLEVEGARIERNLLSGDEDPDDIAPYLLTEEEAVDSYVDVIETASRMFEGILWAGYLVKIHGIKAEELFKREKILDYIKKRSILRYIATRIVDLEDNNARTVHETARKTLLTHRNNSVLDDTLYRTGEMLLAYHKLRAVDNVMGLLEIEK